VTRDSDLTLTVRTL